MNPVLHGLIAGLTCAGVIVFFVMLGIGLCRGAAAADTRPVREDTGEYE